MQPQVRIDSEDREVILPMPEHIHKYFNLLEDFRKTTALPPVNNHDNHSTLALLVINGREVWGINRKTAGIARSTIESVREILKDDNGKSAHPIVLTHAESDALITACQKGLKADKAEMYIDRELCGFCGGKEFNGGSLRRLLVLIDCSRLTVYTPDGSGSFIEVVLTPTKTLEVYDIN